MGMFDWYKPKPTLNCPVCRQTLTDWQGKDGPCLLFVWEQGFADPLKHLGDGESFQVSDSDLKEWKLPDEFGIYSFDCECPFPVEAIGRTENEVWTATELITVENVRQQKSERKAEFKARLKWLQSAN